MKISDTIGMVLKHKSQGKVLSIAPEQSVYEAIELMAQYDIGALLVLSNDRLVGILVRARLCAQRRPVGPPFQRDAGERDHDQPGCVCESATHGG